MRQCGKLSAVLQRRKNGAFLPEHKAIPLSCGRRTCPQCNRRKANRLKRRLRAAQWGQTTKLWTLTVDPKKLSREEAWRTLNKRWHQVHRAILHEVPKFRYFKVIETHKSGYPHIHFLTAAYIDWYKLQQACINAGLGEVIHFRKGDAGRQVNYACKYVTKTLYLQRDVAPEGLRIWSTSQGLLIIEKEDPNGTTWALVAIMPRSYFENYVEWTDGEAGGDQPPET